MASETKEWTAKIRQSELTVRARTKRDVKAQPWRGLQPGEQGWRRTT
jgi:hypothetical protein